LSRPVAVGFSDVVWFPPGEKALAWGDAHGGDDAYRHSGALNVKNVDWLDKVSDEQ
jgi:hypothetical protein